ncbi:MAG: ATP-dependent DNA helicase RecG, partial [Actinobacteria bacterium]|nr:ATP-dependent DNA helicase RecG [Actinomycetota bacterium]
GFVLSEYDLRSRREGDVLGATQSGRHSTLRLLEVIDDIDIVTAARAAAATVIDSDPELSDHPLLAAALADAIADRADYLEKS